VKVERVLAPNPGPYTGAGTNTYVVSAGGRAVVLDPGPIIDVHLAAIIHALGDLEPVAVVVTHTHPDHAPAANPLGERFGVPVLGFAPGPSFVPTDTLADGDLVTVVDGTVLEAVHTPGHTADHLCFRAGQVLFTGDHVIGGSTVIIEDAAAYLRSLERILRLEPGRLYPGHGEEIPDAAATITAYIAHRIERERQVLTAVVAGARTVSEVVDAVYGAVGPELADAAAMQVRTQLQKLVDEGRVSWRADALGDGIEIPTMEDR
jgi:glyoxylase-like metal-dependent hydrolase (beta-lactamase superfamily II)